MTRPVGPGEVLRGALKWTISKPAHLDDLVPPDELGASPLLLDEGLCSFHFNVAIPVIEWLSWKFLGERHPHSVLCVMHVWVHFGVHQSKESCCVALCLFWRMVPGNVLSSTTLLPLNRELTRILAEIVKRVERVAVHDTLRKTSHFTLRRRLSRLLWELEVAGSNPVAPISRDFKLFRKPAALASLSPSSKGPGLRLAGLRSCCGICC